jgi:hypothetical protein
MALFVYFGLAALVLGLYHYIVYHVLRTTWHHVEQKPAGREKGGVGAKRPPWLPYRIPGLGHSLSFLGDPYGLLKGIRWVYHPLSLLYPSVPTE